MTDIKIGDYVTVINAGKQYTTYEDWANSNRLKNWKRGNSCTNGFSGFVTAISSHGTDRESTLVSVCYDGHEIIINVEGVEKVKNNCGMKPIKKGMTEAVTRDGRKVMQLTWFEGVKSGHYCVYGVLDSLVHSWDEEGKYIAGSHSKDIFAPVEYEWQWLGKRPEGYFSTTGFHRTEALAKYDNPDWELIERIEESKREAK